LFETNSSNQDDFFKDLQRKEFWNKKVFSHLNFK
jgi:hypothetical protein